MFTGLVQDIGVIRSIDKSSGDWRVRVETGLDLSGIKEGASICHSGCCLTAINIDGNSYDVDISAESLSKTNIGSLDVGAKVNLEPSLKLGDELGGHFVFGHVDGVAEITDIAEEGGSQRLTIKPPQDLMKYIAAKGSVALDGVSLTVNAVDENQFGINIIPHTWEVTTLGHRKTGDFLNIEIDMLARYVAKQLQHQ